MQTMVIRLGRAASMFASMGFFAACGEAEPGSTPLYQATVETQSVVVGESPQRLRFGVDQRIELEIPAEVSKRPVRVNVSLVTGTARRGRHPVNDAGLLVQPAGLMFDTPVKVRQPVDPPRAGRTYVAVVVPDGGDAFVARTRGRRISGPLPELGGKEIWEGDGDSSGLWGFAEDTLTAGELAATP